MRRKNLLIASSSSLRPKRYPLLVIVAVTLSLWTSLGARPAPAGVVYVTLNNGGALGAGSVASYTTEGALLNGSLITGLSTPNGIAVSGNDVYVVNTNTGTVGKYTTSGATVNASLITGLTSPSGIAVSGTDLYIVNQVVAGNGTIGHYTTSGATINASLFSGQPGGQTDIVVSGTNLFVNHHDIGTIGEYTTAGSTVDAALISFANPSSLALSATDLYVGSNNNNVIGKFTTAGATVNAALVSTATGVNALDAFDGNLYAVLASGSVGKFTTAGATVNASLITGLNAPLAIAVVPEPSSFVLGVSALLLLLCGFRTAGRRKVLLA
jgi:hypothetical protein